MLVSEVMLQQTQVSRVVPVYERFVDRFPTPAACATAPVGEVVRAWAGLGYNRRAVNLHRTATVVVERHGGRLPADLPGLLALPGIGPYTARAVLAFAFEADVAVLDTNVARVLARALGGRAAQSEADGLVPNGRAWTWNSALLDFGATVCTASRPRCDRCPITSVCSWRKAGHPEPDPATVSRESPFAGSDRQGRGRLVDALRRGRIRTS
ncbi:MAG TPA: A/G-specific adenine glycosylase, partial [Actinomycetes bacterium]|nr:A/G-specific adenine glycosylase [Actinomycetes bacterium]